MSGIEKENCFSREFWETQGILAVLLWGSSKRRYQPKERGKHSSCFSSSGTSRIWDNTVSMGVGVNRDAWETAYHAQWTHCYDGGIKTQCEKEVPKDSEAIMWAEGRWGLEPGKRRTFAGMGR